MSDAELDHAILYIADRSREDASFGRTKLNKFLFFADVAYYARHLRSATGLRYIKLPFGPGAPALPLRVASLVERGMAEERTVVFPGGQGYRLVPVGEVDASSIAADFREELDRVIARFQRTTAREISDLSHEFPAWKCAAPKEEIPLGAALVNIRRPSAASIAHARSLAQEAVRRACASTSTTSSAATKSS